MVLKRLLQNNIVPVVLSSVFFIAGAFLLGLTEKKDLHLFFNSLVWQPLDAIFLFATKLAESFVVVAAFVLMLFLNVRLFITALSSFSLSAAVTQILKHFVFSDAERPKAFFDNHFTEITLNLVKGIEIHGENSFPSGHTTTAFSILFAVGLVTQNKWMKAACFLIALAVAFSRIYLSQHFFEDVYAGSMIGIVFAFIFVYLFYFSAWSGRMNKLDAPLIKTLYIQKN